MDGKTIGRKLRALRGEMDAKTVADALAISTTALSMHDRGERIPRDRRKSASAQCRRPEPSTKFFSPECSYLK